MSVEIAAFGAIVVFVVLLVGLRCLDRARDRAAAANAAAAAAAGYGELESAGGADGAELPHPTGRDSWRLYGLAVRGASR